MVARVVRGLHRAWRLKVQLPCALTTLLVLGALAVPAMAYRGDGWFPLPPPPTEQITDVAGLADGSVVVADRFRLARRRAVHEGWRTVPALHATGVVWEPGRGVLAASPRENAIVRWMPGWPQPERVAGDRPGYGGDGGPAVLAALGLDDADPGTSSPAVLADGSVLVPDTANSRVRRIDPAGIITTAAGTGRAGRRGEGGPATAAQLNWPISVAAMPDGGYVVVESDGQRLLRVSPDGTMTRLARRYGLTDVAVVNGRVFVADGNLWRLEEDGRLTRRRAPDFALRGPDCTEAIGADANGGLLTAGCLGEVWYRPASPPARPLVALRDSRVSRHRIAAVFESIHAGTAVVEVRRQGRTVARVQRQTDAGHTVLTRLARLAEGWYRLRLKLTTPTGTARDGVFVYVVKRLAHRTALRLMARWVEAGDVGVVEYRSGRCRSFGPRRVDCEIRQDEINSGDRCFSIASLHVRPSGIVVLRRYGCGSKDDPRFRRRPRWYSESDVITPRHPGRQAWPSRMARP